LNFHCHANSKSLIFVHLWCRPSEPVYVMLKKSKDHLINKLFMLLISLG